MLILKKCSVVHSDDTSHFENIRRFISNTHKIYEKFAKETTVSIKSSSLKLLDITGLNLKKSNF